MRTANGSFEVNLNPVELTFLAGETNSAKRFTLAKKYSGDLNATGVGEMLSVNTNTKGSAGYVAIEYIEGTLHGKQGGFCVQHCGVMGPSGDSLSIPIIPNSGTGELSGIVGKLTIIIEKNAHLYELNFNVPETEGWL